MRALTLAMTLAPALALAQADALESEKLQLEKLRAEVADQVQFKGTDLIDELVLGWKQKPVFELDTPVVLAEVSVPVGFGTGLTALLENHFLDVVLKNPGTHVIPAHCPACLATVVHSGQQGTVLSRGVDDPATLEHAGMLTGAKHAVFLDFEIEGSALVLRARVTALTRDLPIVFARTLTTTTSAAPLLRAGEHLKTQQEARDEYLEALNSRGIFFVPVRLNLTTFAKPDDNTGTGVAQSAPLVWLESGIDVAMTHSRGWMASVLAGFNWTPQTNVGWSLQARLERLLGLTSSLTAPDFYVFLGGGLFTLYGPGALTFKSSVPTTQDLLSALVPGREASQSVGMITLGVEFRIKNRVGGTLYAASMPWLDFSPNVGRYLDLGIIKFHSLGFEVSFWF